MRIVNSSKRAAANGVVACVTHYTVIRHSAAYPAGTGRGYPQLAAEPCNGSRSPTAASDLIIQGPCGQSEIGILKVAAADDSVVKRNDHPFVLFRLIVRTPRQRHEPITIVEIFLNEAECLSGDTATSINWR